MNLIWCLCSFGFISLVLLNAATSDDSVTQCAGKSSKWLDLGGDFCYIVETKDTGPWMEAVNKCYREGGSLASFHSDEEVNRLVRYAGDETVGFYIGLWQNHENVFKWVDKSAVDYENWFPGEPNYSFEKCAEMYIDSGKWNDRRCDLPFGYICSSPKAVPLTSTGKLCPDNWEDLGGNVCYIIETENITTRQNASKRCFQAGGYLSSFHSVEEISVVLQRTKGYHIELFIGLLKYGSDTYIWDDRSDVDFTYFKDSNTDDRFRNHAVSCLAMNSQHGKWKQIGCRKRAGYVCATPKVTLEELMYLYTVGTGKNMVAGGILRSKIHQA